MTAAAFGPHVLRVEAAARAFGDVQLRRRAQPHVVLRATGTRLVKGGGGEAAADHDGRVSAHAARLVERPAVRHEPAAGGHRVVLQSMNRFAPAPRRAAGGAQDGVRVHLERALLVCSTPLIGILETAKVGRRGEHLQSSANLVQNDHSPLLPKRLKRSR